MGGLLFGVVSGITNVASVVGTVSSLANNVNSPQRQRLEQRQVKDQAGRSNRIWPLSQLKTQQAGGDLNTQTA